MGENTFVFAPHFTRAWNRARSASGVVRENRGSPEAGDHDTGVITHENGLSGAGMGRHEGTWAWGDVEKLGSAIVPGSAKRATW